MIILEDLNGGVLDLNSFGPTVGIGWNRQEQATGSFANITEKIPGKDEIYYYGTEYGDLAMEVELWTNSMNLEAMDALWDTIASFAFDDYGKPKLLKMYVSYWTAKGISKYRWVRLFESPNIEYGDIFFKMTLNFAGIDRYKYGNLELVAVENITNTREINVELNGIATFPTITLTGTGADIVLESDNKTINVGSMPTGLREIIIDTSRYVAFENRVDKLMKIPKNFKLVPNKPINISGTGMNLKVVIGYHERFI